MKTTSEDLRYLTSQFLQSSPSRRSGAAVTSGHRGESLESTRHVDWFPTKVKNVISGEKTVLPTDGASAAFYSRSAGRMDPDTGGVTPRGTLVTATCLKERKQERRFENMLMRCSPPALQLRSGVRHGGYSALEMEKRISASDSRAAKRDDSGIFAERGRCSSARRCRLLPVGGKENSPQTHRGPSQGSRNAGRTPRPPPHTRQNGQRAGL